MECYSLSKRLLLMMIMIMLTRKKKMMKDRNEMSGGRNKVRGRRRFDLTWI